MTRTKLTATPPSDRQYWVWVTGPQYYLNATGADRFDLDPQYGGEDESWWTCHRDTKAGDLVLLYRTTPRSDIAYLFEAKSTARILEAPADSTSISKADFAKLFHTAIDTDPAFKALYESTCDRDDAGEATDEEWNGVNRRLLAFHNLPTDTRIQSGFEESYVCDWKSRYKFEQPIRYGQLAGDPHLSKEWGAIPARFRRRVYRVPPSVWISLMDFASATNNGLRTVLDELQKTKISADILSERHLEDLLESRLEVLKPEYDLEIYRDEAGRSGRQYPCSEAGGFMDLLCRDRTTGGLLVLELKITRASSNAVGQISTYIGWVREHLAKDAPVRGLVISAGVDTKFHFAAKTVPDLNHLELDDVRTRLA